MVQDLQLGKFNSVVAQKGYALNKLCYSLNKAKNRAAFAADEDGYCARFGLNEEEQAAVKSRDKRALMEAGGNMYFFAKLDRVRRPA
jgi:protocatechuate 4,5-dioxygenase alpha chain